jgi:single-stranded-DNA-specific exonuclease
MPEARLHIPPAPHADVAQIAQDLGCSEALAQVLVRRGFEDAAAARAWLSADERHPLEAFGGMTEAAELIRRHIASGSRIMVHGDYDCDGVCSTAILVRVLRSIGADVGWFLPSRTDDGYGLSAATVARLAGEGVQLLITADCGITAVEEVAAARSAGMEVIVTDHHMPRSDGLLPDCLIVHPRVGGYPCVDLCAAGVAYLVARALVGDEADVDLELVALATVADCVPLVGENRALVRAGLRALAATRRAGLRALMAVSQCDPSAVDARSCGFRLAPRINAAGRLSRADAGLELMLTDDPERAKAIAEELDAANTERRHVEQRILFEAEGQVAQYGDAPALVLAGEGWHPGVIGIVASRIVERHGRPCVCIALDGESGTGSGRSIPAFDLLGGLDAAAAHLDRHGGHRAAAGLSIQRGVVDAFRAAFVAHASRVLGPDDFVRVSRVDAVVSGDELGTELAEELGHLAPFGQGNPEVALLVPAARLTDARQMGEGKHIRFSVESGGGRARAVAFGMPRLPEGAETGCFDATFGLELNEWNGTVEPRLVLRDVLPCAPGPIELAGEPEDPLAAALLEAAADASSGDLSRATRLNPPLDGVRDRRGVGIAGTLAALVASGDPVLVVCADARARRKALTGRLGGFAITSYAALARKPEIARPYPHLLALDPPVEPGHEELLQHGRIAHLAWGEPELAFAANVHERDLDLRPALRALYPRLREHGADALAEVPPVVAGRALRVLRELQLVDGLDVVENPVRTELERSPSFVAYEQRLQDGRAWLRSVTPLAA